VPPWIIREGNTCVLYDADDTVVEVVTACDEVPELVAIARDAPVGSFNVQRGSITSALAKGREEWDVAALAVAGKRTTVPTAAHRARRPGENIRSLRCLGNVRCLSFASAYRVS
jgi:hypothetical protein